MPVGATTVEWLGLIPFSGVATEHQLARVEGVEFGNGGDRGMGHTLPFNAKHWTRDALCLRCSNASYGFLNRYRLECYAVVISETASRLEMSCSTPGLVRR